jgi:hypothetical protein
MKAEDKKKEIEKRETPIIDGDARPDKFVDPDFSENPAERSTDDKKVTSNRLRDENSLEDYKDKK